MPMMGKPITQIIRQRFSCRTYLPDPIDPSLRQQLTDFIADLPSGPFGTPMRFTLAAASEQDHHALTGLGTYGFIRGASGFLIGALQAGEHNLEDYGWQMERIILFATALGLGTCWLGGTFTKSSFASKIALQENETIPAASAIGAIANPEQAKKGLIRLFARGYQRLPWDNLFFNAMFAVPLLNNEAGEYAIPLEMLRLAPSASNKQPWRMIQHGEAWRFYLQRTPGYRENPLKHALGLCDLQRVDMGIAMCHFELTSKELGLAGQWVVEEGLDKNPNLLTEYVVSWVS